MLQIAERGLLIVRLQEEGGVGAVGTESHSGDVGRLDPRQPIAVLRPGGEDAPPGLDETARVAYQGLPAVDAVEPASDLCIIPLPFLLP